MRCRGKTALDFISKGGVCKIEFKMRIILLSDQIIKGADNKTLGQKVYELIAQVNKEVDKLGFTPDDIIDHIGTNETQADNKSKDKEFPVLRDSNSVDNNGVDINSEKGGQDSDGNSEIFVFITNVFDLLTIERGIFKPEVTKDRSIPERRDHKGSDTGKDECKRVIVTSPRAHVFVYFKFLNIKNSL